MTTSDPDDNLGILLNESDLAQLASEVSSGGAGNASALPGAQGLAGLQGLPGVQGVSGGHGLSGVPGLDIAALSKLANDFMKGLPGDSSLNSDSSELQKSAEKIGNSYGKSVGQSPQALAVVLPGAASPHGFAPYHSGPLQSSAVLPTSAAPLSGSTAPASVSGMTDYSGGLSQTNEYADQALKQAFGFLNEIRPLADQSADPAGSLSSFQSVHTRALGKDLNSIGLEKNIADWQKQTNPLFAGSDAIVSESNAINYQNPLVHFGQINVVPSLEALDYRALQPANLGLSLQSFDVESIRRDFPILNEVVNGNPLVWLDNAATTQKPNAVIDRLNYFYTHENSNIHRSAHELAARSSDAYDASRESVKRFINASSSSEVIFVRGATEAINLVAQSWGRQNIQKDDEILITWLEHHANIVPWQMLCAEKGARLKVAPVDDNGELILEEFERLLGPRTKLVSVTQVSNALGTVTPVGKLVEAAHRHGAKILVDGAQAISHMRIDVQEYDCDFYVFSGHKVFAPTGIGVLYGKQEVLDSMRPWQGGGNMIHDVTFEKTVYQPAPGKFEAGTGSIADAVGLGAAIEYLERIGMENISRHENELLAYGTNGLKTLPGLHLVGTAPHKAGVLSFVLDGFRTEDVSSSLNQQGIAVRAGHHCAQPILRRFGLESTVRPSLALYNTCEDIDALINALGNITRGRGPGPL